MSLVNSHHVKLKEEPSNQQGLSHELLKEVTLYIINHHAPLIVDVKAGKADRHLLECEIISYLDDQNRFSFQREVLVSQIMDYMFGYGLLQPLIDDEDITDIDVCRYNYIMYKKHGKKYVSEIIFTSEILFADYCKLIVIRLGGTLNEKDCHARVADLNHRLRINVTIGPRNVSGASMTIRKHRKNPYDLQDLNRFNMFNDSVHKLLKNLMHSSARILIIGKGASGKTTLLRALLHELPLTERFLVCESESELYLTHANFIVQKVSGQDKESSLDSLIRDGLTMSLDGYCIGELIGEEVYEFLKAGYTDHRIIGTLHAQNIDATLPRIQMMLKNHHKHLDPVYIAGAIDIIIYMKKFKVVSISEVGVKHGEIAFNDLVEFRIHRETDEQIEGMWQLKSEVAHRLKEELMRRYELG